MLLLLFDKAAFQISLIYRKRSQAQVQWGRMRCLDLAASAIYLLFLEYIVISVDEWLRNCCVQGWIQDFKMRWARFSVQLNLIGRLMELIIIYINLILKHIIFILFI